MHNRPRFHSQWLTAVALAKELTPKLPARYMGCLYLDANGEPFTPAPSAPDFLRFRRHFGCLKGTQPEFLE